MSDTGFSRPTITQIRERLLNDLKSGMDGVDSFLRRSFTYVYGVSISGLVHGMYGYLDWIARQVFPDTAESDNMERIGSFWGINRKAAVKATGSVTITGIDGSHVNTGTKLQRGDEAEFITTTAGSIASGTLVLSVAAVEPGTAGNTGNSTSLTFVSPIAGVDAIATTGALSGGADSESDEDLSARVLTRMRKPPHGGAAFDYVAWALEVSGVTRAWATNTGPGAVAVRFMMDDTYANGIPQAGDVTAVGNYIATVRPLCANVSVYAPTAVSLNFSILLKDSDGVTVTDATTRANIEAELKDLIRREAEPGKKMLLGKIREAISTAQGEYDHNITVPSGDVTYAAGQIAVFGAITWLS